LEVRQDSVVELPDEGPETAASRQVRPGEQSARADGGAVAGPLIATLDLEAGCGNQ